MAYSFRSLNNPYWNANHFLSGQLTFIDPGGYGGGDNTIIGGRGNMTIFGGNGSIVPGGPPHSGSPPPPIALTPNELVYGGIGQMEYVSGSGNSTIVGGSGSTTVFGGAVSQQGTTTFPGTDVIFGGSGPIEYIGGSGATTFIGGTGAATLSGGSGGNLYAFVSGASVGTDLITDFEIGADLISLQGYGNGAAAVALQSAHVAGGSTTIDLGDGTQITLLGVTDLTSSSFV